MEKSIINYFVAVYDPRKWPNGQHHLEDFIVIIIVAVI